jgi:hypothetical protein
MTDCEQSRGIEGCSVARLRIAGRDDASTGRVGRGGGVGTACVQPGTRRTAKNRIVEWIESMVAWLVQHAP